MTEEKEPENSPGSGTCKDCGNSSVPAGSQSTAGNNTYRLIILSVFAVLLLSFPLVKKLIYGGFSTGDTVKFGQYPGEADGTPAPIEWIILKKKGGTALLLSRYGIDSSVYNDEKKPVTWENSTLRQRLNSDFYTTAFSEEEKTAISEVGLDNEDSYWGTEGGNKTTDKVFLLSFKEAGQMLKTNKARQLKATPFAVSNGVAAHGSGLAWWWLRSPGRYSRNAACVYSTGRMGDYGYSVNSKSGAVRPAIIVKLRKLKKIRNTN